MSFKKYLSGIPIESQRLKIRCNPFFLLSFSLVCLCSIPLVFSHCLHINILDLDGINKATLETAHRKFSGKGTEAHLMVITKQNRKLCWQEGNKSFSSRVKE